MCDSPAAGRQASVVVKDVSGVANMAGEGMSSQRNIAVLVFVPPVSPLVPDIVASGLPLHLGLDPFCVLLCLLHDRCLILLAALETSEFGIVVYCWRRRRIWWLRYPCPVFALCSLRSAVSRWRLEY